MPTLLRTPASLVWLFLVGATVLSWVLGVEQGAGGAGSVSARVVGVAVLAIAFIKLRLVGLYFMELREAPLVLRAIFETYCLVVGSMVVVLFLTGF